jgi:ribosomal protein L30/L7E
MKKLIIPLIVAILTVGCSSSPTQQKSTNDRQKEIDDSLKVLRQKYIEDSLRLDETEKFKKSIEIINYFTSKPNSVGGVDCNIIWKNISEKTIKYVNFTVIPYNEVNDPVKGQIDFGEGGKTLSVTGPVKMNQVYGRDTYWGTVWYNSSINYMKIIKIEILYLDDTSISTSDLDIIEQLGYFKKPNIN